MVEEESRAQNGDMAPQEDSAKVPLTDGNVVVEIKPDAVDEDTKVNKAKEFKGLTKDELMQYAKEPFWVRLRIFLMILFWAGWLAMLGIAILIIVQAPRCEPPPTSTWLQQSAILQLDVATPPEEATSLLQKLGLTSLYIPGLISDHDYKQMNMTYVKEAVIGMLEAVSGISVHAVTDFVPTPVKSFHPWAVNTSYMDVLDGNTLTLNYDAPDLEGELKSVFQFWQSEYNVSGFLVPSEELDQNPDLRNLTLQLNSDLNGQDIVIGESAVDLTPVLANLNIPGSFKDYITQNFTDWTYLKFSPVSAPHRTAAPSKMPAVTLSLMLLSGTPLMQVSTAQMAEFEVIFGNLVKECVKLRDTDAIKFGETQFANTTDQVVAFTRTLKGTPGYAVAINLGVISATVDFRKLQFVPDTGTMVLDLLDLENKSSTKINMESVPLEPLGGVVLQFVADYH